MCYYHQHACLLVCQVLSACFVSQTSMDDSGHKGNTVKWDNFDRRGNFDRLGSFIKDATVPSCKCLFVACAFMEMND